MKAGRPVRYQLSRRRGYSLMGIALSVARPSRWGNPYSVEEFGRNLAITLFERSVTGWWTPDGIPEDTIDAAYKIHTAYRQRMIERGMDVSELEGFNLACWCPLDRRCHADILLELANPQRDAHGKSVDER